MAESQMRLPRNVSVEKIRKSLRSSRSDEEPAIIFPVSKNRSDSPTREEVTSLRRKNSLSGFKKPVQGGIILDPIEESKKPVLGVVLSRSLSQERKMIPIPQRKSSLPPTAIEKLTEQKNEDQIESSK